MAAYGAIPTSSPPKPTAAMATGDPTTTESASSSSMAFISRAKARGREALASRRPWKEVFKLSSFSIPPSFPEALFRLRSNPSYFAMNYAVAVLVVVFVSLIYHPISLIVFLASMIGWLFFYFLRDEDQPLVLFGRIIPEGAVLAFLSIATLILLLLTGATANILSSLAVGIALVALHALFRNVDDHCLPEQEEGRTSYAAW